ncbi:hypothetical protein IPH70_02275 [Candidatus Roizmanbacteria bacterium]|nr:MAG: hypothetical protein IPH70_02275 [Candidatus Roizmanbacteria bacterium]
MEPTILRILTTHLLLKHFEKNNITVHEINASNKVTLMEDSDSTSPLKLVQRILRRFNLIPVTLANLDKIRQSDALYIGYPGHLDVVWCWLVAQVLGKKLFFYPLVTLSVGFTEEKKLLNRGGVLLT